MPYQYVGSEVRCIIMLSVNSSSLNTRPKDYETFLDLSPNSISHTIIIYHKIMHIISNYQRNIETQFKVVQNR